MARTRLRIAHVISPARLAARLALALVLVLGISVAGLVLAPTPVLAAGTTYTAAASTDWNTNSTWSPNTGHPLAGDFAIIPVGRAVTVNSAAACSTLTFTAGATVSSVTLGAAITLAVSENVTMNAKTGATTTTLAVGTGTLNVGGNLTISGADTIAYINLTCPQ